MRIHLTGVHLKGVHLAGVRLIGVRLRGLHLRGVYPRGVYCAHLTGVYLRDVRLRASKLKEKRKRDTELDQIGGKGATQWCSKRGSLAAGDSVDTESSSTTADPGSISSTLPSSPEPPLGTIDRKQDARRLASGVAGGFQWASARHMTSLPGEGPSLVVAGPKSRSKASNAAISSRLARGS